MTIEERMLKDLGTTDQFHLAIWMLPDGTLVNGSREGKQRDLDHRHVQAYYTNADAGTAILKCMARGNVRMGFTESVPCFEFAKPLSENQLKKLVPWARHCAREGLEFCAIRHAKGRRVCEDAWQFLEYVTRYMRRNVLEYDNTPAA